MGGTHHGPLIKTILAAAVTAACRHECGLRSVCGSAIDVVRAIGCDYDRFLSSAALRPVVGQLVMLSSILPVGGSTMCYVVLSAWAYTSAGTAVVPWARPGPFRDRRLLPA
jgi:hypothetical protein